ncbi:MAG: alkaline phosphatase family protein [Clostridia bacterium]|nr:alkaline phosphatase family protein [Clostridia bacterium]
MKKRKLIILSADAMIPEDVEYLMDKPFVQKIMNEGVWIRTLKTVYPANTYPCHASMITGCYPNKTGVDTNFYDGTHTWRAERDNIKVKTLIDYAKANGYTTANVYWPVLGDDTSIDYNIPEYFATYDNLIDTFKAHGTSDDVIDKIVKPNMHILDGNDNEGEPYAGDFIYKCAVDMILKYNPDVLLIHPCPLDSMRHKKGVFSDEVNKEALRTYDWVTKLYDAVCAVGEEDNTDFVWMSDHGQMTVTYWTRPVTLFTDAGLITLDKDNNIISQRVKAWKFNSSVLVKALDDEARVLADKVLADGLKNKGGYVYYNKEEATKLFHLADYDFDYFIDSDNFYSIGWEPWGNYFSSIAEGVVKVLGTHGHSPEIGYQPTFLAIGPDFKKGFKMNRTETVNIPVTLAKCLGITMEDRDGVVVEEILK